MEGGLKRAALPHVLVAFAGQQAIAEQQPGAY
jgi:hypothetical protein